MLNKTYWIAMGLAVCAWKGLLILAGRGPADTRRMYRNRFGWADPRLDCEWARFDDPARQRHDATNIVVEWVRLDPQRGAKTACAVIALAGLAGIALGLAAGVLWGTA